MASTDRIAFASGEHKSHYVFQMNQYADASKGMIFSLPGSSALGDFAIDTDYTWTQSQVETWRKHSKAPTNLCQLDPNTTLITLVYVTSQPRRSSDGDVIITRVNFERLDATPTATAILTLLTADFVALIPRGAVVFDEATRLAYRAGNIRDEDAPTLGDCLKVGFRARDAVVATDGTVVMPGQAQMHVHRAGDIASVHPGI